MRFLSCLLLAAMVSSCERGQPEVASEETSALRREAADAVAKPPEPDPEGDQANQFDNPSFEQGRDPWFSLASPERPYWADFEVTDEHAHSGQHAAVMRISSKDYPLHTRVYGALREFEGGPLPARVSGWYRVENWSRGADKQYVQVVVAVTRAKGLPVPQEPKQIAYVLAGIDEDPFPIRNRRFVFTGPREPRQGEWVRFEFSLREDFLRLWGAIPDDYATLRVFFEGRFDNRTLRDDMAGADVYFDDLYLGGR